ncbi:hypothetical protein R3X27_24675 [Tropicimonas sp. TH_r6]|uniref:hypothetical protein n=1 Tax=Tropicimonas sp. TH_r6 TaxID=3082085 RepID=UPI002955176D|nr:hypothetical protein [Tropicimonas sp. TH_r6]MDV7145887.1 hypothetical protein [Tropicimonas sp. TH_r6]
MTINFQISHNHCSSDTADLPVLTFVKEHQTGLRKAARLLGGGEKASLVDRCIGLLERERRPSKRSLQILKELFELLSLENVHDPDLQEMELFAVIVPWDPIVPEICLLCDGLWEAMENSSAL